MKRLVMVMMIGCLVVSCGCGPRSKSTEAGTAYMLEEYVNPDNENDVFMSIEYNEREYIPFGTTYEDVDDVDTDECIGYVENASDESDTNDKLYTSDDTEDYLMRYYESEDDNTDEKPVFYRAVDTKGTEVETPEYIFDMEYEFWK